MQPPTLPHLLFSPRGSNKLYFFTTNETRKITHSISCHSKNLIYLLNVKSVTFNTSERRSVNSVNALGNTDNSAPLHQYHYTLTKSGHSINDVRLIPIELIRSKRDSVGKAREAHIISKAKTLHPFGINRRDEARL